MSNITDRIINTIKEQHLAPKPRWQFILRRILIWVFAISSAIIGSLSFSVMIFVLVNNDWEVLEYIDRTPLQHAIETLPYIWILLLILFVALSYYNAKHTKGAYKHEGYWFIIGSIMLSLVVGTVFYTFGLAPRIHKLVQNLPLFPGLMHDRDDIWMEAENGLLAGEIVANLSDYELFELIDLNDQNWIVVRGDDYIAPPPNFTLKPGMVVRMVGEIEDDNIFGANMIMPYHIGPGMFKGKFQNINIIRPQPMPMRYQGEIKRFE